MTSSDIQDFHHIGLITRDMAATVVRYEQLGFAFTPLSVPQIPLSPGAAPEPLGVGNRCAIFANNYLEMLGIIDPARWAAIPIAQRGPYNIDPPMARYEGLHVVHLASSDLDRTRERLLGQGLQPSPIRPFQRLVDTPTGPQMMHARTLSFPPGSDPEALMQIAQHVTPELVLQPRYMQHPNGAQSITEVILCVADPEQVADKYAAYSGHAVRREGKHVVVDLGEARLTIAGADALAEILPGETPPTIPFAAGFTIRGDTARAADFLRRQNIAFTPVGGRLLVPASAACGTALLFEE